MRRHYMSDREAYSRIRPQSRNDRRSLFSVISYVLLATVVVAGLYYLKQKHQAEREQNWSSAVATIVDVRTRIATRVESQRGGAMLYEVQVLAKYTAEGTPQERWITVQQMPKLLADAQFQAFRWKGQTCFVRWKPSDPNQVVAEVS